MCASEPMPAELPFTITMGRRSIVITLVSAALAIELNPDRTGGAPIRGDRLILRSIFDGADDLYYVLERSSSRIWTTVAGGLTAAHIDHWLEHRYGFPMIVSAPFSEWLDRVGIVRTTEADDGVQ